MSSIGSVGQIPFMAPTNMPSTTRHTNRESTTILQINENDVSPINVAELDFESPLSPSQIRENLQEQNKVFKAKINMLESKIAEANG